MSLSVEKARLWTLTNNMQSKVDSFQRQSNRTFVLKARWPTILKKKKLPKQSWNRGL